MDLRRRLVGYLGALLGGLLLMAMLINLYSLRGDIEAEVDASERLVRVLLAAGLSPPGPAPEAAARQLRAMIAGGELRHLSITLDDAPPAEPPALAGRLAAWFGVAVGEDRRQVLQLGGQNLHLAPNPASEIEERLGDTVRLCITLLLFSGATLLVAWWAADRALSPVRELEAGLQRLARGETAATLPPFALREFRRVAGAIDELAAALGAARDAQSQLARQLIAVQEEERRVLARDLHDEMGQTLTAIGVTAAYLERNADRLDARQIGECGADLRRDVRTSGEQLRAMLKRLRPHGLDAVALVGALRELIAGWQQRAGGIEFRLLAPGELPELGEAAALTLYRVVQEALTNVVRHSGARHCQVGIAVTATTLQLSVADDGGGLPAEGTRRRGGLLGMEERVAMVGGSLAITSGADGLTLQVDLPLAGERQEEERP